MIMENNAKNVICPDFGISHQSNAKSVHKKAIMILSRKNVFLVQMNHHFGMVQSVQNAHSKALSGMENIATIAHQELIGMRSY